MLIFREVKFRIEGFVAFNHGVQVITSGLSESQTKINYIIDKNGDRVEMDDIIEVVPDLYSKEIHI